MQIGEVAKLTALSVDAIRFYERSSLLPSLQGQQADSVYTPDNEVARLSFIQKMQGLGFSLRESDKFWTCAKTVWIPAKK